MKILRNVSIVMVVFAVTSLLTAVAVYAQSSATAATSHSGPLMEKFIYWAAGILFIILMAVATWGATIYYRYTHGKIEDATDLGRTINNGFSTLQTELSFIRGQTEDLPDIRRSVNRAHSNINKANDEISKINEKILPLLNNSK